MVSAKLMLNCSISSVLQLFGERLFKGPSSLTLLVAISVITGWLGSGFKFLSLALDYPEIRF